MKERPILMGTPSIQAILSGKKTMTRRIVNVGKKYNNPTSITKHEYYKEPHFIDEGTALQGHYLYFIDKEISSLQRFDKYNIDDILWVRETWCYGETDEAEAYPSKQYMIDQSTNTDKVIFKADVVNDPDWVDDEMEPVIWKPSIFMPKKHCRLRLKIIDIKVERLQDISKEDAIKEGIFYAKRYGGYVYDKEGRGFHGSDPIISFYHLWEFLNEKRGYGWDKNPYVWVIKFKKI